MTNSKLIAAASAKLPGVSIRPHHVASAVRLGMISPIVHDAREFGYATEDVDRLVKYMTQRSRSARREREGATG